MRSASYLQLLLPLSSLKTLLSAKHMFSQLDSPKFWILESTKQHAAANNEIPEAVEDKMRDFGEPMMGDLPADLD